jgi:phage shock protein C
MNQPKRLYRSRTNRQLQGVCGGLGEYFNVDPTLVRLVLIALSLAGGPGFILYILLWAVVPEEPVGDWTHHYDAKRKNEEVDTI